VVSANSSFYRTFQVKEAETEGGSIYGLGNGQWDIPKLRDLLETMLPEKESLVDFEMTHTFESIGERTMLLNAREILRDRESNKMILLAIEDITGRRQAEQKITESVHRYHEMIHSSPSLIAILEGEDLVITEANDAMLEDWGKDRSVMGMPFIQAMPELEGQLFDRHLLDVLRTGNAYRAYEEPAELIRDGKRERSYYTFVYQPQRDFEGKVTGVAIISTEVTAHAEFNKEIRESEARYHQLTDLVPDMITNTNVDGEVFFYNKAWTDFSGWDIKRLKEQGWGKLIHPDEFHTVKQNWKKAVRTGNDFEMEIRILDKHGDYKWHISRAVPVRDEAGKTNMWVGSNTEIQKLKEEEKRKEGFLKMVSHELKTPITSIKGYTQMLLSMMEGDRDVQWGSLPIKPSLERIDNQITRLTRLISEMLDLDRIGDSQLHMQRETFNLNGLVKETIKDLEYANEKANITLQQETNCQVNADRDRIGQVLINFITNAIKYSPDDRDIEIKVFQPHDGRVSVSVRDHGIGIEKNDQPHLFKRFYRVSGKDEQTYSGFGIGLYLAKEIIGRHDGQIRVKSKKGKGSEFIFTLPVHTAADMERRNEDE
jgi:PAS domain S-box-containing protein